MTGPEMKMIRRLMGMTQNQFGSDLGVPNPQVQIALMEAESRPISKRLAKAISLLVDNFKKKEQMDKAGMKESA